MKKQILIAMMALLAFSSCQKSGMRMFRGDYSYKTSGSVVFDKIVPEGDCIGPVSFTVNLPNEIGQLEISDLGKDDSLLVVMNTLGGKVFVTQAFCDGRDIFLKEFTKNTMLLSGDTIVLKREMRVQASGQMYDDNTIVLNMVYDGEAETVKRVYKVHGDNIRMVATRN